MTLTNPQPTLYPGMLDKGIEFFAVESEMKFIANGKIKCTTKLPDSILQQIAQEISKNKEVEAALIEWHPNSKFDQQNQFLKCRFGGLDVSADMENNQFKEGDYWDCPNRANCKFNGLICKAPTVNGQELTPLEINLMKMLATTLTNETIAIELNLPFGSFHKHKQALYAKLGNIQTKQENALIAKSLNII